MAGIYSTKPTGTLFGTTDILGFHNGNGSIVNGGLAMNNSSTWSSAHTAHGWGWGSGKMALRITGNTQTGGEGHAGFCDSLSGCLSGSSTFPQPSGDAHSFGNYVNYGTLGWFAVDLNAKLAWYQNVVWGNNYWNGVAGASPITGVGGYSIASFTPPVYFDICFWSNNNVTVTCDFTTRFLPGYSGWWAKAPQSATNYKTWMSPAALVLPRYPTSVSVFI